ncbi:MAG: hypothetical protein JW929_02710 [Anaerolineales bacterium]|nr:hypothetical protein [Anaerolineales bacterium]
MCVGDSSACFSFASESRDVGFPATASVAVSSRIAETERGAGVAAGSVLIVPWPAPAKDRKQRRAFPFFVLAESGFRRRRLTRCAARTIVDRRRAQISGSVVLRAGVAGRARCRSTDVQTTNGLGFELSRE